MDLRHKRSKLRLRRSETEYDGENPLRHIFEQLTNIMLEDTQGKDNISSNVPITESDNVTSRIATELESNTEIGNVHGIQRAGRKLFYVTNAAAPFCGKSTSSNK